MAMRHLLMLCAALLVSTPALAAEAKAKPKAAAKPPAKPPAKPVARHTSVFDGRYAGAMTLNPALSGPGCQVMTVNDFIISGGVIQPASAAASLQPVFDGFVTDDGFIKGHFRYADSSPVTFEGRAEKQGLATVISGGVLDESSHCSWVVNLTIQ